MYVCFNKLQYCKRTFVYCLNNTIEYEGWTFSPPCFFTSRPLKAMLLGVKGSFSRLPVPANLEKILKIKCNI